MPINKLLRACILPALLCCFFSMYAQDKTITGKITDIDGNAVSSATVTLKNSTNGTTTLSDGTFSLTVPATATTLVISSIGYLQQEVDISNVSNIAITLGISNSTMDEVVVVAYGTRRKGDLTGAVTSITPENFQKGQIASSEQLLVGKVAGLQITSGGGSAGGGSKIRIRGGASLNASNEPLIVVDGIPVESNGISGSGNLLSTINPNDIESMSVLKDASATALYGSRASNGVIIITTKKGTRGKVKFNFNTQFSMGEVPEFVDVLTGDEIRQLINDDAAATGVNTYKNLLGTANTNWQDEIYQKAYGTDNNISASGSIGMVPFRASIGYNDQDGVLKTNNFKRTTGALNLNPKFFNDHLAVNVALKLSQTKHRWANEGAVGNAVTFDPTKPVYESNKYGGYYEWLQTGSNNLPIDLSNRNPLALLELRDNSSRVNRFIGNVQLDYKLHFFPDLHVLLNVGVDNANGKGDDLIDSVAATNYKTRGLFTHYAQVKENTLVDVSLFYDKNLSSINSKLDLLVGHSYQDFVTKVYNFEQYGRDRQVIPTSIPNFAWDKPQYRLESYFGRANINIAQKYLLTATLRRDASSKFSPENRVGYFPSLAFAWRLKDEFFKTSRAVTDLKLRLGWGVTGQQDGIGYYSYLPRYTLSGPAAQYQFGNNFYNFIRPEGYDPSIKWETTTTQNIGFDFAFIQNRISGAIDVYQKKTEDLLSDVPVAPGANFVNRIVTNVGNVENKGIEISLNTVPVRNENLTWDFGVNFTYNETDITNLLKNEDPNFRGIPVSFISGGTGNTIGIFAINSAPYTFDVFKQVYDPVTGRPIEGLYEDINRDGQVDEQDRYFYKKPAPDFLLGASTQVTYKNISLGAAAHGMIGNYQYNNYFSNNGVIRAVKNPINFIGNASRNYLESGISNNQYISDYYIENASFFRIDNINLGYNVGQILKGAAMMRISASIQNVAVFTKYQGLDPEISSDAGIDNNIYPRPRTYAIGFNVDF
ncbi:MAG: SusC/RagA family TonB-linked outer membrane protein [Chitinophagaceae bacterium]|nr:SusC/RagA family TonB-linked outer membrane protein [Chitinophagaceae bacterium]